MNLPFKIKLTGIDRGESGTDLELFDFRFFWRGKGVWNHCGITPEIATKPNGKITLWGIPHPDGTRIVPFVGFFKVTTTEEKYKGIRCGQLVLGPLMIKFGVAL